MNDRDFPTRAEVKVMRILRDHPRGLYGLQIVEKGVKRGSVYVLLSRLEEKGFVGVDRPAPEPGYPGLPRPHYRLNAEGARVLEMAESFGMLPAGA